jgi:hypothetical protein
MSESVVLSAVVSSSLRSVAWVSVEIQGKGRGRESEVVVWRVSTTLI